MGDSIKFTVRPFSKVLRNGYKDCFRIYLSASSLLRLRLRPGDICKLEGADEISRSAIAWTASERIQDSVVQTSKLLQDLYGLRLGDKISISKEERPLEAIDSLWVEEQSLDGNDVSQLSFSEQDVPHWMWALEHPLLQCELVSAGMLFELELKGSRKLFKIREIQTLGSGLKSTIFRFTSSSKVHIRRRLSDSSNKPISLGVDSTGLGGLQPQLARINERLGDYGNQDIPVRLPSFYTHDGGILLYGPKGVGKSALLSKIQGAGWKNVFIISLFTQRPDRREEILRKAFSEALLSQPSLISIDNIDFLAPKNNSQESSFVPVLNDLMDSIQGSKVLVVAAAKSPNDVDDTLRTPHRLSIEIELSIPTANDRKEILTAIRGADSQPTDDLLCQMAEQTHGYVGADLFLLMQLSCRKALYREISKANQKDDSRMKSPSSDENEQAVVNLTIEESDFHAALQSIRPTAMREVFLETPNVKWNDIGGQQDIKYRLQKAVERPLKLSDRMKRLNIKEKKGILLYGPPGCSKTLLVKALATEAGLNFLAVKGAEVLSMYVGESERALREIFRKARSASPSIIFFDEIDAIASSRGGINSHGSVNMLTTLLNEMDGIEELRGVLVVAATNKPEILDPALMRPGRLDNIIYIGPPDFEARREILHIWITKSAVDDSVNINDLAIFTDGYSGAELVSICEHAADLALEEEEQNGKERDITWAHFQCALSQVPKQLSGPLIDGYEIWRRKINS